MSKYMDTNDPDAHDEQISEDNGYKRADDYRYLGGSAPVYSYRPQQLGPPGPQGFRARQVHQARQEHQEHKGRRVFRDHRDSKAQLDQ